ncbi:MAG: hypothetical protein A2289_15525 [Deltaproteobacteria bacterium RIFOXYA12_FULL_58_15]|nr:MAG: hypothetical protein A2289_15525 [Deltaproteobacteria bacterium RIFOXYA12_FULL_58_15]OGR14658.1 MAG: hypothetical protein A2341_22230 [Deltaproteobacteria bacterium RIFOXYB12_FULL_58_9]
MSDRVFDILAQQQNLSHDIVDTVKGDEEVVESRWDKSGESLRKLAAKVQKIAKLRQSLWNKTLVRSLVALIRRALADAQAQASAENSHNEYAIQLAVESIRAQIKQLIDQLEFPPELADSPEIKQLIEQLMPKGSMHKSQAKSEFSRGSNLRGKIKREVMTQQVAEAVKQAAKIAAQRLAASGRDVGAQQQFSLLTLDHMARLLKRKIDKKKKKSVGHTQDVANAEEVEEDRELQEMLEIFSAKALETMRALREEIAPTWAPDQQPWLIHEADQQVYEIILACIPKELFEETAAYQEIQDLRAGQAVFTLRAADRIADGAARKP